MHILILPSWYPATMQDFHGSFFREQAEAIAEAGHTVGVVNVSGVSLNNFWAQKSAVFKKVVFNSESGLNVGRALVLRPVPLCTKINLAVQAAKWWRSVKKYVEVFGKPDVIQAHTMNPAGIVAHKIAKKLGIPFIVTEHRVDTAIADIKNSSLQKMLREVFENASATIAVSPGFAEKLNETYKKGSAELQKGQDLQRNSGMKNHLGPQQNREWIYVPNLISKVFETQSSVDKTQDIAEKQPANTRFTFGHVSNLDGLKRVDLLIEAFAETFEAASETETQNKNFQSVRLVIAGDGPNLASYKELAQKLGATNIEFIGRVNRADAPQTFDSFDAFVAPSDAESFGVVYWEAMARGVPIIATATDGGKNAVAPHNGYLIPIGDKEALKTAMQKMVAAAGHTSGTEGTAKNKAAVAQSNLVASQSKFDPQLIRSEALQHCGQDAFTKAYENIFAKTTVSAATRIEEKKQ